MQDLISFLDDNSFNENLEKRILDKIIFNENQYSFDINPFYKEKVSNKLILIAIITCTIIIISTIKTIFEKKTGNNT